MADTHPPFSFLILARPPPGACDEPPILACEDTLREAKRTCREMGGALIQKSQLTDRMVDGGNWGMVPEYEHVEYLTPKGEPTDV